MPAIVLIAGVTPVAAQTAAAPAASQFIRDAWGASQGFPGGGVSAIAQTPDGYLWIGTEKGLVRFDGTEFRLEEASAASTVPITRVLGLIADSDGTLWIRQQGARLVRYHQGRFENVIAPIVQAEAGFTAMTRDAAGRVLLTGLRSGLVRPDASGFATLVPPKGLPNSLVIALAAGADGTVWIGTRDIGLFAIRSDSSPAVRRACPIARSTRCCRSVRATCGLRPTAASCAGTARR